MSAGWKQPHPVATQADHAQLVATGPYLEFFEWECGHHQACPEPVRGVAGTDHALQILHAIGAAISQPGSCRARWVSDSSYLEFYATDDYACIQASECDLPVVLCDPTARVPVQPRTPGVIEYDALWQLAEHLCLLQDIEPGWTGTTPLDADAAVLTSLSVDQVHALARDGRLPPLRVLDAGAVLDEMLALQEAEPEPLPEDGSDDGRSTRHYPPLEG